TTCPMGNDCNDNNFSIHPDAVEICSNGIDENCDGSDMYCTCLDSDSDTYFKYNATTCPMGNDCNDNNFSIHPNAVEICGNSVDENCNGYDLSCLLIYSVNNTNIQNDTVPAGQQGTINFKICNNGTADNINYLLNVSLLNCTGFSFAGTTISSVVLNHSQCVEVSVAINTSNGSAQTCNVNLNASNSTYVISANATGHVKTFIHTFVETWDKTVQYNTSVTLNAILKDNFENPVEGKKILFYVLLFNGSEIKVCNGTTNEQGLANCTYFANLTPGSYEIEALFVGDENYTTSSDIKILTITKISTNISTSNITTSCNSNFVILTATLTTENGSLVDNAIIRFYVNNGYVGYNVTNLTGVAIYYYNISILPSGNYSIKVEFVENEYYLASNVTRNLEISLCSGVMLQVVPSSRVVNVSENVIYTIIVTNIGNSMDTINLTINNIDGVDFATLNQTNLTLDPGESRNITLNVRDNDTGSYMVNVTGTSQNKPSENDTVTTNTTVSDSPVYGVELYVTFVPNKNSSQMTGANIEASYTIIVYNTGNVEDNIFLNFTNIDNASIAYLNQYSILLPAGGIGTVYLNVTDESFGTYIVNVTGTSSNDSSKNDTVKTFTIVSICGDVNESCYPNANIRILIDGIETDIFNYSGRPYNITVIAKDSANAPISNLKVQVVEWNGHNPFALSQFGSDGNDVTNYAVGEVKTGNDGKVSFTLVPTGGIHGMEKHIGPYKITANIHADCSIAPILIKNFNVYNRNLPGEIYEHVNIPNRYDVLASNDRIYIIYDKIKRWNYFGSVYNITIYTNGTTEGLNFTVGSGEPVALNVSVKYPNGTPTAGKIIRVVEKNGHNPFALTQYTDSDVTNYAIAEVKTDGNGNAKFTIVPTGGVMGHESEIGNYNLTIGVITDDTSEMCKDRVFPLISEEYINNTYRCPTDPYYPTNTTVYNMLCVQNSKDYVYNLYYRIKRWAQL
ncbi:MAG: MopE-related protein, partial [Candidatus Altarchaeum sp.]|nr:MopE-related protein [Candidatus Altarchaeum sp.]